MFSFIYQTNQISPLNRSIAQNLHCVKGKGENKTIVLFEKNDFKVKQKIFCIMRKLICNSYQFSSSKSGFFFIFGAPGVGKGTYASMLVKDLGLSHISTGDEIRKYLKTPPDSAKEVEVIREIVRSGGLISDDTVLKMIQKRLEQSQNVKGVIIDGYPRTKRQLDLYLQRFPLHGVLNLRLRDDVLTQKLLGRRNCVSCGAGFNLCNIQRDGYSMVPLLPKLPGICDNCGGALATRQDDAQHVIAARLKEYHTKAEPLLAIFKQMGVLMQIEPKNGLNDYPQIKRLFQTKLKS